jgi:hypothetical protein
VVPGDVVWYHVPATFLVNVMSSDVGEIDTVVVSGFDAKTLPNGSPVFIISRSVMSTHDGLTMYRFWAFVPEVNRFIEFSRMG